MASLSECFLGRTFHRFSGFPNRSLLLQLARKGLSKLQMNTPKLDVLFRSCSRVSNVHGATRLLGLTKQEVILSCLHSLIQSMKSCHYPSLTLTIIDDHSNNDCILKIKQLLAECPFPCHFIEMNTTGNSESIRTNYDYARANCSELIYFVEDDYLHESSAIKEMLEAYTNLKISTQREVVVHPCDYPDRYDAPYPSIIFKSPTRYWRSIHHTTGTFLLSRTTFDQHWSKYEAFSGYGSIPGITEDNTINQVYATVPCFSPMPSLALHFQDEKTLSPYVDWQKLWNENAERRG